MRRVILSSLIALALAGCSQSATEQTSSAPAAPAVVETPATPPAAPVVAEAVAVVKAPEGTCGDQSAIAADERIANTPKWTTASEQDNFGFDVFRSDSEEGEFVKLNEEPILGAGTSDETHKYQFRDDSIDPCKEYWYYVEAISTNGVREKFTPTFKAAAKRSPKTDSAE
ncbi:MAG: hypothetical protein ABIY56_05135 [Dokdonella sp.]